MKVRERWLAWGRNPLTRTILFVVGVVLVIASPVVGIFPGPGGILVFAVGAGLMLKYSEWAKRKYVAFKKRHPNKGRWTDWSMRRASARRREEIRQRDDGGN